MKPALSSLFQAVYLDKPIPPLLIGERANATGSKQFREALLAENDEGCLSVLKLQEQGGADILDLSVAYAGRDEKDDMVRIVRKAALRLSAPLMIDSTRCDVIEQALKNYPGRAVVNSINLEKGVEPLRDVCRIVRRYGAAVVGLTIDEDGMALTASRKRDIAERIASAASECGLREQDLFFDPLTFTLASGDAAYAESALETLEAIRLIKKRFPLSRTVLGISNVSFGLPVPARKVLNSVFLAEAVARGLDAAIIDPSKVIPLNRIDKRLRQAALDLIENRRSDALSLYISHFRSGETTPAVDESKNLSPEDRLRRAVIDGDKSVLEEVLPKVLKNHPAEDVLNSFLIGSMKEVGDLFGKGEMLLPFVLQSAETLRRAVELLQPFLRAAGKLSKKPLTVLLATVAGDVHDIGKNLVGMILENNGFEVRDIGVKAEASLIIDKVREYRADMIGLSGLLVKSALIMKEDLRLFNEAGLTQPVLLGGAALSESFVKKECAPLYAGPVRYCDDAFASLQAAMEWRDSGCLSGESEMSAPASLSGADTVRESGFENPSAEADERPFRAHSVPKVPFTGSRIVQPFDFQTIEPRIARKALFGARWKLGTPSEKAENVYRQLKDRYAGWIGASAVYGYFPCAAEKNSLMILDSAGIVFGFPRTGRNPKWALSDFYNTAEEGADILAAAVITLGDKWHDELTTLRETGRLTDSFYLYGFLAEAAEAAIDEIHCRIFSETGIQNRPRIRFSFGYPACPDLSLQQPLFTLLKPERIGVTLSDSFMMEPEFSISALIPLSPDARYF